MYMCVCVCVFLDRIYAFMRLSVCRAAHKSLLTRHKAYISNIFKCINGGSVGEPPLFRVVRRREDSAPVLNAQKIVRLYARSVATSEIIAKVVSISFFCLSSLYIYIYINVCMYICIRAIKMNTKSILIKREKRINRLKRVSRSSVPYRF